MKISKIMAAAAMLFTGVACAASDDWAYKLERNPIDGHYIKNIATNQTSTHLHGTFVNDKRYARMTVKLKSFGYFTESNIGHIVFMVGMSEYIGLDHSGNGVIIGNTTEYRKHSGVCTGNPRLNAIATETFYPNGNCVYGNDNGLTMRDGVEYTITITVDDLLKTVRTQTVDEYGDESDVTTSTIFSDISLKGKHWGIAEVMSRHSWSVYISEPVVTSHW